MRTKHPGFRVVFHHTSARVQTENRLHGTATDSLVDFNDTEMGAGRILINDLSVDSPKLSGNDRMGGDVEFSCVMNTDARILARMHSRCLDV